MACLQRWLAAVALLATAACSSKSPSGASADAGDEFATGVVSCADDPRVDTYTANLEKEGAAGVLSFRVSSADPAPPSKGQNTFVVEVSDASGNAMSGELGVALYMPDHGHGTSVVPQITFDAQTDSYTVKPLYLFMAGVWRITFTAYDASVDAGAPLDSAAFYFCVDG